MSSGVYKIFNTRNNKCYIGSSVNIENRWKFHKSHLLKNTHHCKYLQNAYNKYGNDCFTYSILETCDRDKDILLALEQQYLDILKPEYNHYKVAGSPLGMKHTEETKRKMSLIGKGRKFSEEHKFKISTSHIGRKRKNLYKPIAKICPNTNKIIEIFKSVQEASNNNEVSAARIASAARGVQKTSRGFIWEYKTIKEYETHQIMKHWRTFNLNYKKFGIFGMMTIPNTRNFNIDLIPGIALGINDYELRFMLSWLIFSIEFDYTIKEQKLENV
jgi:group I intron endonuclease